MEYDPILLILLIIFLILLAFLLINLIDRKIIGSFLSPNNLKSTNYSGGAENKKKHFYPTYKLQKDLFKKYPEYRKSLKRKTFDEFCYPKSFKVQESQSIVREV
jgi:ABC-type dipeptide/oligopeptide/nickel transport system permease component